MKYAQPAFEHDYLWDHGKQLEGFNYRRNLEACFKMVDYLNALTEDLVIMIQNNAQINTTFLKIGKPLNS